MRYLVTGKEMKLLDENTSRIFNIPSDVLMEQAAIAFVQELILIYGDLSDKKILILCGNGNNGGDGVAIGRLLNQQNINAVVCPCMEKESGLFEKQMTTYREFGFPLISKDKLEDIYDIVIDGIFGTGLSRNIDGEIADIINAVNNYQADRIAIDISSGVYSEDGKILGVAFKANHTITFSFEKIGLYLYPGADYTGELHLKQISISIEASKDIKPKALRLEGDEIADMLPNRYANSHKGTYGKLLVIAGSINMAGAACFAAKSAYRSGAGLVKVLSPEENRTIIQTLVPEAILETYSKELSEAKVLEAMDWASAILIGPGLGTGKNAKALVKLVLKNAQVPLIIDADAINIISENPDILLRPHFDIILTPHLGEMSRLTNMPVSYIQTHLIEVAQEFANKYNVVCHLKDARSVTAIPYGNHVINVAGNHGMATAGSGDVLSGIISSLVAQGMNYDEATFVGARIHADAGDIIAKEVGKAPMIASDIINGLTKLEYFR